MGQRQRKYLVDRELSLAESPEPTHSTSLPLIVKWTWSVSPVDHQVSLQGLPMTKVLSPDLRRDPPAGVIPRPTNYGPVE